MKLYSKSNTNVYLVLVLCLLFFTGCAVRTPVPTVSIADVKANLKYESIIFRIFEASPNVENYVGPLTECRRFCMDYLELKHVFKKVERDNGSSYGESSMFVDVTLTNLRIVSGAGRFWGGALSGRSNMNLMVKLSDTNGSVIAEQELIGAPNAYASAWSFGSADRQLPEKMGYLLGDFILANVSEK